MDQDAVDLLLQHMAVVDAHQQSTEAPQIKSDESKEETDIFFRHVSISKTAMVVDYKPKQIKLQNVKDGNIAELINLFQFDGERIEFEALHLHAVHLFSVPLCNHISEHVRLKRLKAGLLWQKVLLTNGFHLLSILNWAQFSQAGHL